MAFETYIISWNITKRCNLHCAHCYLDASYLTPPLEGGEEGGGELSTTECFRLIDQMAEVNPKAVLILTGGEPLLRKDIFQISKYASDKGFLTVLGTNGIMIRAKCAPHFKRIAYQSDHESPLLKGYIGGCRAGTNYCRITPEGDVTPCPYMPDTVGNVKNKTFSDIWWNSETFIKLRHPEYKGKCQDCEYKLLCGGCRARALASNNDYMGDDPWCLYKPEGGKKKIINLETNIKYGLEDTHKLPMDGEIVWTDDALKFLENIPFFARAIAKKGVEKYAREMNYKTITISVMKEAREKRAGKIK